MILAAEGEALAIGFAAEDDVELAGVELKQALFRCQVHVGVVAWIARTVDLGADPGENVFEMSRAFSPVDALQNILSPILNIDGFTCVVITMGGVHTINHIKVRVLSNGQAKVIL